MNKHDLQNKGWYLFPRPGKAAKKVLMPKQLTAENGAKSLFMDEFEENIELECQACGGTGENLYEIGETCKGCDGAGFFTQSVPVSWTTIKEIYAMAVKHLASNGQ